MATIVRALWLAAKGTLFSCNNQALLATCPRHIQSVFNVLVDILIDIRVMVNCRGTAVKKTSADQCHLTVSRAQLIGLALDPIA